MPVGRVHQSNRAKEIKKDRRKKSRRISIIVGVLALMLIGGLVYVQNLPQLQITNIKIEGTHALSPNDIEKTAREVLAGKYLYIIPKTNSFLYPHRALVETIRTTYPRIKDFQVTKQNTNTLVVSLSERESVFLWCGDALPVDSSDAGKNCYFSDENGYLFSKAPYFSGIVYFKIFGGLQKMGNDPLGGHILTSDEFKKLTAVVDDFKTIGITSNALIVYPNNDRAYLLAQTERDDKQKIIFRGSDTETLFQNLSSALSVLPLKDDFKEKFDQLLYIDLRYPNKVYYKFQ